MLVAAVGGHAVGAERADLVAGARVRGVALVADEVHRAAQGVRAEAHRDHAPVDVDALHEVERHARDGKVAAVLEGDAVEEEADLIAVQAIEREALPASQTAVASHDDALRARQHFAHVRRLLVGAPEVHDRDGLRGPL